jgi:PhnB protein
MKQDKINIISQAGNSINIQEKAVQNNAYGSFVIKIVITFKLIIMAQVSTYLNFARNTEEAFNFYKSVFGNEFTSPIVRFGDFPPSAEMPPLAEEDRNLVMHVGLPILGGHLLMGTDAPESMQFRIHPGNNVYLALQPDTRSETKRLFNALSEGGKVEQELQDMFWGDYYGSICDKFGVRWMFICSFKV